MTVICEKCGKSLEVAEAAFCPFCGAPVRRSAPAEKDEPAVPEEVKKWLGQIEQAGNIPARKKLILKARKEFPDCFPIEWEYLFIGHEKRGRNNVVDFSIIKSYLLKMYMTPDEFSAERKQQDRKELFGDEQLLKCLSLSPDPDKAMRDYLIRLSREFIDYFIEGDSGVTRRLFGFRIDRNPEKTLSNAVAAVLEKIRSDSGLAPEQRDLLYQCFYQAFSIKMDGRTEWLSAALDEQ